jgi:hypothetical protein
MLERISFLCPSCRARLRAPAHLAARTCPCPVCRCSVNVPVRTPAEEAPVLVLDDGHRLPRTRLRREPDRAPSMSEQH